MAEMTPQQQNLLRYLVPLLQAKESAQAAVGPSALGTVLDMILPSSQTVEKMSYGDMPFRMPTQSRIPITTDKQYLADLIGVAGALTPAAKPVQRGVQQLVREIQTTAPKGQVKLPGQGLSEIKKNAKKLSEKDFLDAYVTQTLPEHLTSKNFPIGVRKQEPHEFLPPSMLDPSEWDSWSDRSMAGTVEKVNEFRKSLKEGARFPPVLVHSQKGDFPYVEDGHHRMAAYIDEGYKTVPVSFDISSLIKIWKEENQSPKKVSEIYKDYTQGLLNSQPASGNLVELFLSKAEKFPSDYNDIAPQEAIINVSQLIPTQKKVSQIAVDQYKAGGGSMGDLPVDVVFDTKTNQYLIVDGHHRVAAMIESGFEKVPVQIIGEK